MHASHFVAYTLPPSLCSLSSTPEKNKAFPVNATTLHRVCSLFPYPTHDHTHLAFSSFPSPVYAEFPVGAGFHLTQLNSYSFKLNRFVACNQKGCQQKISEIYFFLIHK
jgi:hypothetical protein